MSIGVTPVKSAMRGVSAALQSAATTGNGIALALSPDFKNHRVNISGSAGIASGTVQIESAEANDYAGTWSPIAGGPITVPVSSQLDINFSGVYKNIRARISANIVGGTVTVIYQGN